MIYFSSFPRFFSPRTVSSLFYVFLQHLKLCVKQTLVSTRSSVIWCDCSGKSTYEFVHINISYVSTKELSSRVSKLRCVRHVWPRIFWRHSKTHRLKRHIGPEQCLYKRHRFYFSSFYFLSSLPASESQVFMFISRWKWVLLVLHVFTSFAVPIPYRESMLEKAGICNCIQIFKKIQRKRMFRFSLCLFRCTSTNVCLIYLFNSWRMNHLMKAPVEEKASL